MGNINKIKNYFLEGCNEKKQLGVELEHFICNDDMEMISYEALCCLMERFCELVDGILIYDHGHIIGMDCGSYCLSLEPAGQLEISIMPAETLKEVEEIYDNFRRLWEELLEGSGYDFLQCGVFPTVENGEVEPGVFPLIPKKRYEYMDEYFKTSGTLGRYMMRATASTQVSIDYSSEEDAMRKLRLAGKLAPLLSLLMENQNGLGRKKGWKTHLHRTQIWRETDRDRCGYFPGILDKEYGFKEYAEYVYQKPIIFIKKDEEDVKTETLSAAEICREKELYFTEHLLSMFFPHVRLKKYVEIRVADSVSKERMLGYAALIKGLFYREENLKKMEEMFEDLKEISQLEKAENSIMEEGYYAQVYGKTAVEWLYELIQMADACLAEEERGYLKALMTLPILEYEYRKDIKEDQEAHTVTGQAQKQYILNSTAKYHNRAARSMYIPKMFTETEIQYFSGLVEELFGIFDKVMEEYRENEEYRALFGFDKRTEELILKEEAYHAKVPMARVDIFYNEETKEFQFCEFNTDGTSAMNEDRELNHAVKLTKAYETFAKNHEIRSFELFDTWVEEFLKIYREYAEKHGRNEIPNVVITDFLEHATTNEFKIFQERFRKRGIPCEICDARELSWDGSFCYTKEGMRVDAVYRRAVTSDVLHHFDEVQGLMEAAKANGICLVGEFRTQIVHNKILYKVLHLPETQKLLTKKEQRYVKAHVPYTVSLTTAWKMDHMELYREVLEEKDQWIIKPEDSYGSYGVHAGVECEKEEWEEFVEKAMNQGYILQRFCHPYRLPNVDLLNEKPELRTWCTTSNLSGLFVYNGKFRGIYSRVSFDEMISTQYNEMSLATMVITP